jgi:WD40 repeat protein
MYNPVSSNPNKALGAVEHMVNLLGQGDATAALAVAQNSPDLTPDQRERITGIIQNLGSERIPAPELTGRLTLALSGNSILVLPPEDLLKITSFLDVRGLINLSRTCEFLNRFVQDFFPWQNMYDRTFCFGNSSQDLALGFDEACKKRQTFETNSLKGRAACYHLQTFSGKILCIDKPIDFQKKELLNTILTLPKICTAFFASNSRLYSCFQDGQVKVWDSKGTLLEVLRRPEKPTRAFCDSTSNFFLSSNTLALSYSNQIEIWDLKKKSCVQTLETELSPMIGCVAISEDNTLVYAGLDNGKIQIWDKKTGAVISSARCHDYAVKSLLYFNNKLYSSASDGIKVWNSAGKPLGAILPFKGQDPATPIVPLNHRVICVGSEYGVIALFDLETQKKIGALTTTFNNFDRFGVCNGILYAQNLKDGEATLWDFTTDPEKCDLLPFLQDISDSEGSDYDESYGSSDGYGSDW